MGDKAAVGDDHLTSQGTMPWCALAYDALTAPVVCPEQKWEILIGWDCGPETDSQQGNVALPCKRHLDSATRTLEERVNYDTAWGENAQEYSSKRAFDC